VKQIKFKINTKKSIQANIIALQLLTIATLGQAQNYNNGQQNLNNNPSQLGNNNVQGSSNSMSGPGNQNGPQQLPLEKLNKLQDKLKELAGTIPGLENKVELSVNGVSMQEFIRGIAIQNNLNINVDPSINIQVVNNFNDVTVNDVLLFVCKNYNLDINFFGSILSLTKYSPPPPEKIAYVPKKLKIEYNDNKDLLTLDLSNDSLSSVIKEISKQSKKNVIASHDLYNKVVSGYIQESSFPTALYNLAISNDLKVTLTEDNFYLFEKKVEANMLQDKNGNKSSGRFNNGKRGAVPGLKIKVDNEGLLNVEANNVPLSDVINEACNLYKANYFLLTELKGFSTSNITGVSLEEFLKRVFNGTEYTFQKDANTYIIGERTLEGLRTSKVFPFKFRTVEKVMDFIPPDLKKGIDIKAFPDLNSLILSGSQPRIEELVSFLREIDRTVPVIQIEITIIDYTDTKSVSTGIEAGLGTAPATTSGTVFPSPNVTISATSLNNFLNNVSGGAVNLGQVTPNFYLNLKALETQGIVKIRSTPRLATLNGHEAKMTIGDTEYYLETSTTLQGSVAATSQTAQNWKTVNADLEISINPIISADNQITLDVKFKQSTFTARISPTAPPGTTSRNFQALIRVKNDETILLGGLEESQVNDTGSGIPILSRIPIIKWFFSSRTKSNTKTRLSILIKPTVLY